MRKEKKSRAKVRFQPRFQQILVWLITVCLSVAYIAGGYRIFSQDVNIFNVDGAYVEKGRVEKIGETVSDQYDLSEDITYENNLTYFTVTLLT
ncbi:MAG: hypothetical protein PHV84_03765, partial [Eubacteriales bacterium]|nr:hypothetical protein [Eubacteriales bacterium]